MFGSVNGQERVGGSNVAGTNGGALAKGGYRSKAGIMGPSPADVSTNRGFFSASPDASPKSEAALTGNTDGTSSNGTTASIAAAPLTVEAWRKMVDARRQVQEQGRVIDEAAVHLNGEASFQWIRTGSVEKMEEMSRLTVQAVAGTLLVALILFYAEGSYKEIPGDVKVKIPTISHLGGWGIGKFVFTGGLHICAFLFGVTAWCVKGAMRQRLQDHFDVYAATDGPFVRVANGVNLLRLAHKDGELTMVALSYWVALTSAFFLYLSASFPLTYWGDLHNALSAAFFFAGLVYMKMINNVISGDAREVFLVTRRDYVMLGKKNWAFRCAVLFALCFLVIFPVIEVSVPNMNCYPFTGENFCALESVRSVMEWLACFSMFTWFYTLRHDIQKGRLLLLGMKQ